MFLAFFKPAPRNESNNNASKVFREESSSTESTPCDTVPHVDIDKNDIQISGSSDINKLDNSVAETRIAEQSDEGYRKLAEKIVRIAEKYLSDKDSKKSSLRQMFAPFFNKLLVGQYIVLVVFILLDAFTFIPFEISESLIHIYIISVFVETLGTISIMLVFAFTTKEEATIVNILTTIIENYQKYTINRQ